MSARGRQAFRPTPTIPLGVDVLECRQLLSAVIDPGGAVLHERVAAVVAFFSAPPADGLAASSPVPSPVLAGFVEATLQRDLSAGSWPAPHAEGLASMTPDRRAVPEVRISAAAERDLATGSVPPTDPVVGPVAIGGHGNPAVAHPGVPDTRMAWEPGNDSEPKLPPPGFPEFLFELVHDDGPGGPISGRWPPEPSSDIGSTIGAGVAPSRDDDPATPDDRDSPAMGAMAGPISVVFRGGLPARPVNANAPTGATATARGLSATAVEAMVLDAADPAGIPMDGATGFIPEVTGPVGDRGSRASPPVEAPALLPRCADLLTEFLPFNRTSLEDAVDRFLAPLEDVGSELVQWRSPTGLVPATLVVAAGLVAWDVARRSTRGDAARRDEQEDDLAVLPGDPAAWSLEG